MGPPLLIYVNYMLQVVKCHFFLYAYDSRLFCQRKDINEIEKQLNVHFASICDTKPILFSSKFKKKNINKLNVKYDDMQIKRSSKVNYLMFNG